MARHGENIRKRKDGRWEGRYLAYSKEKDKQLYRSVYGRTYEEVKEKLLYQKSILNGMTVGKWGEEVAKDTPAKELNRGNTGKKDKEEESIGKKIDAEGRAGKKIDVEGNISKKINDEESIGKRINNGESLGEKIYNSKGMERENTIEEIYLGTMAEEWLEKVKINRKTSTYIKYHLIYRNYLETPLRDMGISKITNQVVLEKISGLSSESMGKSVYCVLNQILKYASEKYALKSLYLKRPVSYMRKKPVETLSRKELSALLSVLYQEIDLFKCAVLLCLCTGLRLGEVCALKWEDIDMENQLIAVNRTVQRLYVKGYTTKTILLETAPKSIHSSREIPLPSVVFSVLKEVLLPEGRKKEYVFGGDKPAEPRTMQNHFKRMLEKAGIPHKNFHTLRHTFSTNCIEGGTDVKSLSEILGHSDVQITLNRYIHPSMDMKRRHLDTLSEYYHQISGSICGQVCGQSGSQSYGQAS